MKIGLLVAPNERTVNPADLARAAEALGFESLWMPDHAVMPVHSATPLPETRPGDGGIPDIYYHICDPMVAMAMAAAATTRLMVATGVLLVPERNPLLTANELATLDRLSGGRVILGIGAGWLREESEILGADFAHRWTQTREYVAAMRELWTREEASFEGRYVNFPPVRCYPKPARKGGPPVIIGSKDRNALRWVARWGDGWCPIFLSPAELETALGRLRAECDAAERDFARMDITIMRRELRGARAEVQSGLEQYAAVGAHRFVVMMLDGRLRPDNFRPELERIAALYV
ncbi:MAG TPA: LLM class F420-dependent oxidoreductase [Candidatus Binataceae bacterium]|nr:LLM class F420-dependent oxidoreductase [Candidatus Binataceae bacterium]